MLWSVCSCSKAAADREDVVFISGDAGRVESRPNSPPQLQEEPSERCIPRCPQCWLYAREVLPPLGTWLLFLMNSRLLLNEAPIERVYRQMNKVYIFINIFRKFWDIFITLLNIYKEKLKDKNVSCRNEFFLQ
jgi:hypothetical protein